MKKKFCSLFKSALLFVVVAVCLSSFTGCEFSEIFGGGHRHEYKSVVTPATCTTKGYTTYVCDCGYTKTGDYVAALGHTFVNYTSNGDGTKTGVCIRNCGEKKTVAETAESGELAFHFPMLGNASTGDSIFIQAGDTDILIDCGSQVASAEVVKNYLTDNELVSDGVLEYVIVTHADKDHIAGFSSTGERNIFSYYECEVIIDFNRTNKSLLTDSGGDTTYGKYVKARDAEVEKGAKRYSALDCYNNQNGASRTYYFGNDMSMSILYNYFYEHDSTDENNYSVCTLFTHGDRNFLFTGDLESEGEEYLVKYNDLPEVELYKAGHHGSKTSSNECLLSVIKPRICVVCCCAGTAEYTNVEENQFPTQQFIDRISAYTDKVYIPLIGDSDYTGGKKYAPLNGNIKVLSNDQSVSVQCSVSDVLLKDTDWFKTKRKTPSYWTDGT